MHDFIEQADADSEIAGLVLSDSENQSSKLKLTGTLTKPLDRPYGLLDSEVTVHRDFEQFSKMRAALQDEVTAATCVIPTRKQSYRQGEDDSDYLCSNLIAHDGQQ